MNVNLDFVEKLDIDPQKHSNEIRTLQQLSKGLMSLSTGIRRREQRYEALAKVANFSFFGGTSDQEVDDLNLVSASSTGSGFPLLTTPGSSASSVAWS